MIEWLQRSLDINAPYFPYIIAAIAIFAIGLMIYVTRVAYKAARLAKPKGEPEQPKPPKKSALPPIGGPVSAELTLKGYFKVNEISIVFLKGLRYLRKTMDTLNYKYRLPWYLLVGSSESGKTSMLEGSELRLPIGMPKFTKENDPLCRWWFFNRGIILDIKGYFLIPERGVQNEEKGWRSLLTLLARYRSSKPIDGIILTIPITELYGKNKLTKDEITDRARHLSQRLIKAQKGWGLRLPVYVVITKSDLVPGFQSLCQKIPHKSRHNILGWSSPYPLNLPYAESWLNEAFANVKASLHKLRIELFAQSSIDSDSDQIFVLPNELVSIKDRIKIYTDLIFQESTFDESLAFRGIYFVGDSGIDAPSKSLLAVKPIDDDPTPRLKIADNTKANNVSNNDNAAAANESAPAPLTATPEELAAEVEKPPVTIPEPDDEIKEHKNKHIYFVHDLVAHKIFRESGLAQPMHRRLITANRSLNIAKIALAAFIIIGSFGVYNAYNTLTQNRDFLLPPINRMAMVLQDIAADKTGQSRASVVLFDDYSKQLLSMMDQIHNTSFFSLFVPASWFSPLEGRIQNSLKISYEQIIVRTLHMDLQLRIRDLINMRPLPQLKSDTLSKLIQPASMYEYGLLKRYVEQWALLLANIKKYNRLKSATNADPLQELVKYSFNIKLPDIFVDRFEDFQTVFREIPYPVINIRELDKPAKATLHLLYEDFVGLVLGTDREDSILGMLKKITTQFGQSRFHELPTTQDLRDLAHSLGKAMPQLGDAGNTWLDKKYFDPGGDFVELIGMISESELFGPLVVQKLAKQTARRFANFQDKIKGVNDLLIEKPLLPTGKQTHISQGILELSRSLVELFNEPFMLEVPQQSFIRVIPAGKLIFWDEKLVQIAVDLAGKYDTFIAKKLGGYPPVLQTIIKELALRNLQGLIVTYVAKAQTFVNEPRGGKSSQVAEKILLSKISDMKTITPKFIELLEILEKDKAGTTFVDLREIMIKISTKLLREIESLMIASPPYQIPKNNFDWWRGSGSPTVKAFNAVDQTDIQAYLERQRKRISTWAKTYAEPIVLFLTSEVLKDAQFDRKIVDKWKRMVDEINKYESQQPDNSLNELETFIAKEMIDVNLKNCFDIIPMRLTHAKSNNFFSLRLTEMRKQLRGRCEVLKRKRSMKHYGQLVRFFNEHLKGKFPFISPNAPESSGEVEPEDLHKFFGMYDKFGGTPEDVLDQIYQLGQAASGPLAFLKALDSVRDFFAAYLDGDSSRDVPNFDIDVSFRVNRDSETSGNHIIEWYFKPNDSKKIESYDKKKSGQWTANSPVEFGFKWSDSSSLAPGEEPTQKTMSVEGKTAKFRYSGRWSILKLIRAHGVAPYDVGNRSDPNPYTLSFEVPAGTERARVFNRLVLKSPQTSDDPGRTLTIPRFPIVAPKLNKVITDAAKNPVITFKTINKLLARYNLAPVSTKDDSGDDIPEDEEDDEEDSDDEDDEEDDEDDE